jgi:hypothetical protein
MNPAFYDSEPELAWLKTRLDQDMKGMAREALIHEIHNQRKDVDKMGTDIGLLRLVMPYLRLVDPRFKMVKQYHLNTGYPGMKDLHDVLRN